MVSTWLSVMAFDVLSDLVSASVVSLSLIVHTKLGAQPPLISGLKSSAISGQDKRNRPFPGGKHCYRVSQQVVHAKLGLWIKDS